MTRIIRVDLCDRCPYAIQGRACSEALYFDDDGLAHSQRFDADTYPEIPSWCPLEEAP